MDAEVLPGNVFSPVHPFLSLVINLNVATLAHRDRQDKELCVVLAVGDFDGGCGGVTTVGTGIDEDAVWGLGVLALRWPTAANCC